MGIEFLLDNLVFWCFFGYLCGSIPFGLILSNLFGNGRLREEGSKNIGATNVLRTQGKVLGALTLLLDASKGFVAVFVSPNEFGILVFCWCVLGHLFPVWLKFNGGKGVATFLGGILCLNPTIGSVCALCWLGVYSIFKISSISGMVMCVLGSLMLILNGYLHKNGSFLLWLAILIICILILIRHKDNINRLLKNEEKKI